MKRRDFLNLSLLTTLGGTVVSPALASTFTIPPKNRGKVKNIIFMVSDGMSSGTPNMADLLLQRKEGRSSLWFSLYRENRAKRALMDTASADSLVTDSAAGSSSWGGGVRVKNGALNVDMQGVAHKPILQKFKDAGKAVGCVTTVPITHATPAGFCISCKTRGEQEEIANLYLPLKFDVMMGGGEEFFSADKRKDKKDLFGEYSKAGYAVVHNKAEMNSISGDKPVLGVFHEDGLPYTLDQKSAPELMEKIPSLAEMTSKAISLMSKNPKGFVLQVEGGKVDWGAHANDIGALLYDQIAFDDAIDVAVKFAESRNDTLVIITTDHGNSNPGLIKSTGVDAKFDKIQKFNHTNEWILTGINKNFTPKQVIDRVNEAQGIVIKESEAGDILTHYASLDSEGIYNAYKLPYKQLAQIQQAYTSVGWAGMDHTGEFVELAMFGAGSENLPPFVKNTDLHNYMLHCTGVDA